MRDLNWSNSWLLVQVEGAGPELKLLLHTKICFTFSSKKDNYKPYKKWLVTIVSLMKLIGQMLSSGKPRPLRTGSLLFYLEITYFASLTSSISLDSDCKPVGVTCCPIMRRLGRLWLWWHSEALYHAMEIRLALISTGSWSTPILTWRILVSPLTQICIQIYGRHA